MGLVGRKPILPAPTESLVDESIVEERVPESEIVEEVATDLSQRSDRTHHTIPEDGSPITISTKKPTSKLSKITKSTQNSQTSLLIEYFEAGKGSDSSRRPSVRVKVVPSSKNKTKGDVIFTEATKSGTRKTSRRISLDSSNPHYVPVDSEPSILHSLHIPDSNRSAPLDIEIQQHSDYSDMSASPPARYIAAPSDISSMPADSMLGVQQSTVFAPPPLRVAEGSNLSSLPAEESVLSGSELKETTTLKPPVIPQARNLSSERLTQKVMEKLAAKPRNIEDVAAYNTNSYNSNSKTSSRSGSRDVLVGPSLTRGEHAALKAKNFRETESTLSPTEPSMLSNSVVSGRSGDSARSAISAQSINNPRLLQTVEDAIRRLILPELKEIKRDRSQRSSSKHDKDYSDLSEESIVREKTSRRSTSGEKTRRRRSSKDHGDTSASRRRRSTHRSYDDYDSYSDTSSRREASTSSISADDPKKMKKTHRARDMAAAGLLGAGLTAAALESKESEESLHRRRRRKRSKSRSSRTASIAESEELFRKHKVPPMPMQSEISSEVTRSSILSSNTGSSMTPTQHKVREVARGEARELQSPDTHTPPRQSGDLRNTLGMHHGNFSEQNLSSQKLVHEEPEIEHTPESDHYHSFSAEDLLEDPERMRQYERNLHTQHPIRRGLSPIQSVASYQTTEPNRNSMMRRSADSLASTKRRQQQLKEEVSISSFTSATPDLKKLRPKGINLENTSEIMAQHDQNALRSPDFQSIGVHDRFGEDEHDNYRDSFATSEKSFDNKRFSGFTDTSSDVQYVDKVTAGQNVANVHEGQAQIVPMPWEVESGVASLVEPSVLSMKESSPKRSFVQEKHSARSLPRELVGARMTSPLKDHMSVKSDTSLRQQQYSRQVDLSPPQSPARSFEENQQDYIQQASKRSISHSSSDHHDAEQQQSPQSEITTNPSVIQGPIGGFSAHTDPWRVILPTPTAEHSSGAVDLIPQGLNLNQRHTLDSRPNTYVIGSSAPQQRALQDEGYATGEGDNYPSPAPLAKTGPTGLAEYDFSGDLGPAVEDPFTTKRDQYVSGFSQGMSPLYETATGKGVDRIESKDIIHLMEHLTVRDAQRNARDTEILYTLVRSAAEMRESFEEMKNFIVDQDAMIMETADEQHAQTQKVVGGPRQMPTSRAMSASTPQEDLPSKRRNVFKRALQGLGSKNTVELQNIEGMLMQLLDEVEALRSQQVSQAPPSQPRTSSFASEDAARPPTDTGYEPEGRAGTASSGGDRSLYLSNNSSRQGQFSAARRVPENRVSTVMEGDEDLYDYEDVQRIPQEQQTPKARSVESGRFQRGQSEPLRTPPRVHDEEEITPTTYNSAEKSRKTFSSFLPNKFVSRWSKTTASTEPHSSEKVKQRPFSQVSRSGSNINDYEYEYSPDDRLRSATSLQNEEYYRDRENRPPSPLVPSAVSDNPKYQAHRNSQNLQHPQPRQGPTSRYQDNLDVAAQTYLDPHGGTMSPVSQASSYRHDNIAQAQQGQYIPHSLSPISDDGSYTGSITRRTAGPPRPPKISDRESGANEPLFPQRPPKVPMSPSTYVDDVRAARAGSPAFDKSPVTALRSPASGARKPSGPRPLSSSSNREARKTRFNDSPVQSVDSARNRY